MRRAYDCACIRLTLAAATQENGGRVVKSMKKAQIAILPEWSFDEYKELYAEATAAGKPHASLA